MEKFFIRDLLKSEDLFLSVPKTEFYLLSRLSEISGLKTIFLKPTNYGFIAISPKHSNNIVFICIRQEHDNEDPT